MLEPASLRLELKKNNKTKPKKHENNNAVGEKEESGGSASEKGFLFFHSHAPRNIPLDSESISTTETQSKPFSFTIRQRSPDFA